MMSFTYNTKGMIGMKIKIICFICCISLMLNGCGISKIAENLGNKQDDLAGAFSDIKIAENKPPESPAPAKTAQPINESASSAENQPLKLPSAIGSSNASQSSFENGDKLALVLADASSEEFQRYAQEATRYDFHSFWGNKPDALDEIIIVAQMDMAISFESVYFEPSSFFKGENLMGTFLKEGESIIFEAYLTESIPDFRIFAFAGGDMKSYWYNSYYGPGEHSRYYMVAGSVSGDVISYNSSLVNMAGAMATVSAMVEGFDAYIWESIRYALTLDMDLYDDENIVIAKSIIEFYKQAINPYDYPDAFPELYDNDYFYTPHSHSETYVMAPLLFGDIASWKCVGIDKNIDGNGYSVFIDVYSPDWDGEYSYSHYEVVFENNSRTLPDTPFAYEVSAVRWINIDDDYMPYYEFMETDEWKKYIGMNGNEYVLDEAEYYEYILVDIDSNGTKELWIESNIGGSFFPLSVSSLYTITKNGEVEKILSAHETGGSIGGTKIAFAYDMLTDSHVIDLHGHVGGFGGDAFNHTYYSFNNNIAEEIVAISILEMNNTTTYSIDGEDCSEGDFYQIVERFTQPIYDQYIFPEY